VELSDTLIQKFISLSKGNPVVAAYGMLAGDIGEDLLLHKGSNHLEPENRPKLSKQPVLEWRVQLDSDLVSEVWSAMESLDSVVRDERDTKVIESCESRLHKLVSNLMSKMKFVGDLTGPAGEGSSFLCSPRSKPDEISGIVAEDWLRCFAECLRLALDRDSGFRSLSSENKNEMAQDVSFALFTTVYTFFCVDPEEDANVEAEAVPSFQESAAMIENLLGQRLNVILYLDSPDVPPRVWAKLIETIRSSGIAVNGIASLTPECSRITSLCTFQLTDIRLFHSAGDLHWACQNNEVKKGGTVFFNAASLIFKQPLVKSLATGYLGYSNGDGEKLRPIAFHPFAYPSGIVPSYVMAIGCKSRLEDYKQKLALNIGVYVHESEISPGVLDALVRFVNDNRRIYNLGLAWGGINGLTLDNLQGDGYGRQRFVGKTWDPNLTLGKRRHRR
jgi:hypothetical protein